MKNKSFYIRISVASIVILLLFFAGLKFFDDECGYVLNVYSGFLFLLLTVMIIEQLAKKIANQKEIEILMLLMNSQNNMIAVEATKMLRQKGCDNDGSLRKIRLFDASLSGANLYKFDLQGAFLKNANLNECDLYNAKLRKADLSSSKLIKAILEDADLESANLKSSDMTDVNLKNANLKGADLTNSILKGADLSGVDINKYTVLPDGTKWSDGVDLKRFL